MIQIQQSLGMQIIDIEEEKRPVMDIENEVDHSHQNKKKYEIIISKKGTHSTLIVHFSCTFFHH